MEVQKRSTMADQHTALVLRMASPYKGRTILLDEELGKIEVLAFAHKASRQLFHGAFISCALKKRGARYVLSEIVLLDMPHYWVGEHFLFFHHVLELCDSFLSFDEYEPEIFKLVRTLYSNPVSLGTKEAQKLFLCDFFQRIGMYPDQQQDSVAGWLRACITEHPHGSTLQTASFLNTLDVHEEAA